MWLEVVRDQEVWCASVCLVCVGLGKRRGVRREGEGEGRGGWEGRGEGKGGREIQAEDCAWEYVPVQFDFHFIAFWNWSMLTQMWPCMTEDCMCTQQLILTPTFCDGSVPCRLPPTQRTSTLELTFSLATWTPRLMRSCCMTPSVPLESSWRHQRYFIPWHEDGYNGALIWLAPIHRICYCVILLGNYTMIAETVVRGWSCETDTMVLKVSIRLWITDGHLLHCPCVDYAGPWLWQLKGVCFCQVC